MSLLVGCRALNFIRLANALTVSQPVHACSPIMLSQMLSANDQANSLIWTNRVLFWSVSHTSDRWDMGYPFGKCCVLGVGHCMLND